MQSTLRPIRKRSTLLKEEIYDAVKTAILSGKLRPGERFTLAYLADVFQVSRTPIRDAITRLAAENLVQSLSHKGFLIIGISERDLREIFEIRAFFEALAAVEACKKRTPNDLNRLSWYNQRLQNAGEKRDLTEHHFLNDAFHFSIYEISEKMNLCRLVVSFREYYRVLRTPGDFENTILIEQAIRDHVELIEAIEDRNKSAAQAIAEEHVLRSRDKLLETFRAS